MVLIPGNRTFSVVVSMVVTWWIVAFLPSVIFCRMHNYYDSISGIYIMIC